jgi:hypothetical protein
MCYFGCAGLRGTMSQFRSEEMNLVQLFVQSDAAHDTLHELGQIGAIQFKDVRALTPPALLIRSCACFHGNLRLCAGGIIVGLGFSSGCVSGLVIISC